MSHLKLQVCYMLLVTFQKKSVSLTLDSWVLYGSTADWSTLEFANTGGDLDKHIVEISKSSSGLLK